MTTFIRCIKRNYLNIGIIILYCLIFNSISKESQQKENLEDTPQKHISKRSIAEFPGYDIASFKKKPQRPHATFRRTVNPSLPEEKQNGQIAFKEASKLKREAEANVPMEECRCNIMKTTYEQIHLVKELSEMDAYENKTIYSTLEMRHPNFPLNFVNEKERCDILPPLSSIYWNSDVWQDLSIKETGGTFNFFSAVYDGSNNGSVFVLTLYDKKDMVLPVCHIWFSQTQSPIPIRATRAAYVDWQQTDDVRKATYFLTCPIPERDRNKKPLGISLTEFPCEPFHNLLNVYGDGKLNNERAVNKWDSKGQVKEWAVGVCGPALYYYHTDISTRLIEWIEIQRLSGVSKVFLYETKLHPNNEKVFRFYENQGYVKVIKFSYPSPFMNEPGLRRFFTNTNRNQLFSLENIHFTDCILRNKDSYKFLSRLDTDELTIIQNGVSFPQLMTKLYKTFPYVSGFGFVSTVYNEDVPPGKKAKDMSTDLYFLSHSMRFKKLLDNPANGGLKHVFNTEYGAGANANGVIDGACLTDSCIHPVLAVNESLAHNAHYRYDCGLFCTQHPQILEEEMALLNFGSDLKKAVKKVKKDIGLL